VMAAGLAENDEIVGIWTCGIVGNGAVQLVRAAHARRLPKRTRPTKRAPGPDSLRLLKLRFSFECERGESMRSLSVDCCSPPVGRVGPGRPGGNEVAQGGKVSLEARSHLSTDRGLAMGCALLNAPQAALLRAPGHSAFVTALLHIARRNWFWIHDKSHCLS